MTTPDTIVVTITQPELEKLLWNAFSAGFDRALYLEDTSYAGAEPPMIAPYVQSVLSSLNSEIK